MARTTPEPPDAPDGPDEDEEAFHWAGDEVGGREGARLPTRAADDAAATPGDDDPVEPDSPAPRGSAALTFLFGAAYLVLTVGWILGTGYTSSGASTLLPEVLWQFAEFTAIISAPLWFATTVRLTRGGRLATRVGWLALGLGVLLPWPILPVLLTGMAS